MGKRRIQKPSLIFCVSISTMYKARKTEALCRSCTDFGKNPLWKQEVNSGRHNNQNFVSIPHARFIGMLAYKAELVGIQVEIQEESYTSKASFLDLDPIPTYKSDDKTKYTFSGKRIGRRNR